MTQVRFGNGNGGGWAYKAAEWTYTLPDRAEKKLSPVLGEKVGGFIKNQLNSDFAHFTSVEVGSKFKTLLAEPPKLPLLFLLYPATVGPREWRAYQRGKENNDFREMGDVARRDLTAITLFVFALGPTVKKTSELVQWLTGVNLLDKANNNSVLNYSQFRNYEITNGKALWQVVKEGNGDGLKKAINKLNDGGLSKHGETGLQSKLDGLKEAVKNLAEKHAGSKEQVGLEEANKVYKGHFVPVRDEITDVLERAAKKENSKEVIEIAKKLQGQAKDALQNYAKVRRLPTDMFAFALMVVAIGWLPMAFNGWWNKKQFEKKQAAGQAGNEPAQKAPPAPQPFPQPINFRSFPGLNSGLNLGLNAQHPVNPFNNPFISSTM